jgi:hypothetical protein
MSSRAAWLYSIYGVCLVRPCLIKRREEGRKGRRECKEKKKRRKERMEGRKKKERKKERKRKFTVLNC